MKRILALSLVAMAFVVTGCPHNEYTVELTPQGDSIERKLVFYRAENRGGSNADGTVTYQAFPKDEIAHIRAGYPRGGVTNREELYTAIGKFAGQMPDDVGGAGSFTNLTTTMGAAAYYMERFRGNDDAARQSEKRLKAMDQIVDLMIGWSGKELGDEPHYRELRKFLEVDFRHDLRNLNAYWTMAAGSKGRSPEGMEEFGVRFAQYLAEHGYVEKGDVTDMARVAFLGDEKTLLRLVRRLVATKLKMPAARQAAALAFLDSADAANKSFDSYLATTSRYRTMVMKWREDVAVNYVGSRVLKNTTNAPPVKPQPSAVTDEIMQAVSADFKSDTPDRVIVKLKLPAEPLHSNGKWDAARGQVVWDSDLTAPDSVLFLPVFCYAAWHTPAESFQREHFGKVVVEGDSLMEYCLWRTGLSDKRGREWDAFVSGLRPGAQESVEIGKFRFRDEPGPPLSQTAISLLQEGLRGQGGN